MGEGDGLGGGGESKASRMSRSEFMLSTLFFLEQFEINQVTILSHRMQLATW
jgi:hypothetical protein